jgi:hypothetical protein
MAGEAETLWRCRECGKWSTAKRDPIRHERSVVEDDGYGRNVRMVVCGPFDPWVAFPFTSPNPRPALPNLGETISEDYYAPDPNEGIEVPF